MTRWASGAALGHPVPATRSTTVAPGAGPAGSTSTAPDELAEGCRRPDGRVLGTSLHGLFEADAVPARVPAPHVAGARGRSLGPAACRSPPPAQARFDRLADAMEAHLDMDALERLIDRRRTRPRRPA